MLNETCILVGLSIGLPPQTKVSKEGSQDVETKFQTAKRQGLVVKHLFSAKDIKGLTRIQSEARTLFNELSLPYDASFRIIPTNKYFDFVDKIGEVSLKFDTEKHEFLQKYDDAVIRARIVLGKLFDPNDYPSKEAMEKRIHFKIESSVIPPMTAFDELAGIGKREVEQLKAQALIAQQQKIDQALHDLFKRIFTVLHKACVKLSNEDSIFRDTLISNILEAVEAAETLNLTDNEELKNLSLKVRSVVEGVLPDDLRKDKELRKQTAKKTKEILTQMEEFF